jgi:glutamate/aspartate transport system permease protein
MYDFSAISENLGFLAEGMELSLLLTALATCGGILFGTLLAVARLSAWKPLALLAAGYVNLFRSVPLILVIFWFYFLVPLVVGRPVGPFYSVSITFVIFEAAYYCEIIRAGIQNIPRGQAAAAQATGMTYLQSMVYIVLPQALRKMVPVLLNQAIALFQDTSLVYVVALRDFMTSASIIALKEYRQVELFIFAAAVYFVICFAASLGVRALRRRESREARMDADILPIP